MPGELLTTYSLETDFASFALGLKSNTWTLGDKRSGVIWGNRHAPSPWVGVSRSDSEEPIPLVLAAVEVVIPTGTQAPPGMENDTLHCRFKSLDGHPSGLKLIFRLLGEVLQVYAVTQDAEYKSIYLFTTGLEVTAEQQGEMLLPIRMGLLLQASRGSAFSKHLGTYDYEEGVHMAMAALFKNGSALMLTWADPYVALNVSHTEPTQEGRLRLSLELEKTASSCQVHCLGTGGLPVLASAYRKRVHALGYRVTWEEKFKTRPQAARLFGACNVKLWTALARRIDKDMVEQSVTVKWTFDEAAHIAEHLKHDLELDDVLFHLGGWTRFGYDCKHPDNMPANPECGGNAGLADCAKRVQDCGYLFCLHDNYQDIYRDAPSWDEALLQKNADGSPRLGGVWLGGQAYYTCAREAVKLAQRPENLPMIRDVAHPDLYFIDTTYAVGPQECFDPRHPLTKQEDIQWKIELSDYARDLFGMFGSECGREWAVPHADFFEGLASVSGNYYHRLDPYALGGRVVPFFDMVFRDCIIIHGKYGYKPEEMAEQVIHHIAMGRTLYYHALDSHLYWENPDGFTPIPESATPRDPALFTRADSGWAYDFCTWDRFIKNTQSILGPLNKRTSQTLIRDYTFLDDERLIRKTAFGNGTTVVVNGSDTTFAFHSALWGEIILPPFGFLVDAGDFVAFYAAEWWENTYENPPLFTLESMDGQSVNHSKKLRVYHGFGATELTIGGRLFEVGREAILEL
ncbi:MAG: DUF5696 domain-containing protein [Anaerolineae bacterium]|nr:DUF5696 domain-containing protein [Anaerolineae bacterium]